MHTSPSQLGTQNEPVKPVDAREKCMELAALVESYKLALRLTQECLAAWQGMVETGEAIAQLRSEVREATTRLKNDSGELKGRVTKRAS